MPTLYSYFISNFSEMTHEIIRKSKPFTIYHRQLMEYEITESVLKKIKEPILSYQEEIEDHEPYEIEGEGAYAFQEAAVKFSNNTDNILLNFSQGMGKTLTTLKIIENRALEKVLVVCGQSNLQEEWLKDSIKHKWEYLPLKIVGEDTGVSNARKNKWLKENPESALHLINIEALRNQNIVDNLNNQKYDAIVIDEVQSAKGWKAEQTQGTHELHRYEGQVRIALSGTPVLNNPLEFFSVLRVLDVLKETARTTFERYYGDWGFDFWGHWSCRGYKNLEELAQLLRPVLCYAPKTLLNLPIKTRHIQALTPEDNDRYKYLHQVYNMTHARLKREGFNSKPEVRALMQYESSTATEKYEFLLNTTGRKLVFSQFTRALDHYYECLTKAGKKVLYYHGKLSMKQRLDVLDKWREEDYEILLLSTLAARYGLNLTEATTTIFLDVPTSLTVLEQCEDRTHRIGQTLPCTSYVLCSTTIDEKALENMKAKQIAINKLNELTR